jgi:hypothetical protein
MSVIHLLSKAKKYARGQKPKRGELVTRAEEAIRKVLASIEKGN